MTRIVMKFGGTSVGTLERIENVAARVQRARDAGHEVVLAISAMSGETNRLIALGQQLAALPAAREMDVLLHTGELVSVALLAIALEARGVKARSFSGHQARIVTDASHTKARIRDIDPAPLAAALREGEIPVVAGFQGISPTGQITTLGRGGSDLTAVALAYALKADQCHIYTDVDGVYTADPNIVPAARKIPRISFEEMLELASQGAKVMQSRSVEFAMKYNVPFEVRTSFSDEPGTLVSGEEPGMENLLVSGIAHNVKEAKVTLRGVPDRPGIAARVFAPLAAANINVDMIVQSVSTTGETNMTFTVAEDELKKAEDILRGQRDDLKYAELITDRSMAKISVVGVGMRSHAGVAAKMFETLAQLNINIQAISTSEIKISVLIEKKFAELAVRELHSAFGLDDDKKVKR